MRGNTMNVIAKMMRPVVHEAADTGATNGAVRGPAPGEELATKPVGAAPAGLLPGTPYVLWRHGTQQAWHGATDGASEARALAAKMSASPGIRFADPQVTALVGPDGLFRFPRSMRGDGPDLRAATGDQVAGAPGTKAGDPSSTTPTS